MTREIDLEAVELEVPRQTDPKEWFVVEPDFKGAVDVTERLVNIRKEIKERIEKELETLERNAPEIIKNFLEQAVYKFIRRAIGIESFDEVKRDSPLGRAIQPHLDGICRAWAAEFAKRPVTPQILEVMKRAFAEGYQTTARSFAYKLGGEVATAHETKLRYELLGTGDLIEQVEKKMLKQIVGEVEEKKSA